MVMLYGTDGNSNMIELEDDFCFQNDPNPIYYITTKWLGDIEGWDPFLASWITVDTRCDSHPGRFDMVEILLS